MTDRNMTDKLAAFIELSGDAIVDATLDGIITGWNPAAEALYGYAPDDIIGRSILLLSPQERADEVGGVLAKVKAGQPVGTFESVRVRRDGTKVAVLLAVSPVHGEHGPIIGVRAIVRDVSDRKRAEQELRRMAAIVEHANDAIVDATTEGVITNWNPAAERMFGISRDEVIGKSFTFIEPSDRLDEIRDILAKVRTGQPVGSYESVRVREDGSEAHISLTISPVKDADGVIIGVSAIGRDVTSEVRAKREIADWRSKAFKWMEEVERSQRLSVEREFERELLLIDLQQQLNDLRGQDPPERGTSE